MNGAQTVTALDIGSSKVVCAIAELSSDNTLDIVAGGVASCRGVNNGVIVDFYATVDAINKAISDAESTGYSVGNIIVGLSSENLMFVAGRGVTAIGNRDGVIRNADIARARDSACLSVGVPADNERVMAVTRSYNVDGQPNIAHPEGLIGLRLEAETYIGTASSYYLKNIRSVVKETGYNLLDFLPASMASALAVLTDDERDIGTLMLDIGMGTVDLAVYYAREIGFSAVLANGGCSIIDEVAVRFNIPKDEAERIIINYGAASREYVDPKHLNMDITAMSAAGDDSVMITPYELADTIKECLMDIIEWIRDKVNEASQEKLRISGIVLTGGLSWLRGIDKVFYTEFRLKTRVGTVCCLGHIPQIFDRNPCFSTVAGLLAFGAHIIRHAVPDDNDDQKLASSQSNNFFVRFIKILLDFFGRMCK